ncbi:hypothetical protein [Mycobacterium sp. DL440]|uniref:hypothetical protein n=1 Tax=Mycobacterium sp. DL440 TaxID=2675523 RepID=UPI0014244550|nr:hypothetical protein [Mycobacterium sp. DL440]
MGKRARLDRRSKRHIKVDDAAEVITGLHAWAERDQRLLSEGGRWIASVAGLMEEQWTASPVVLRVDGEFAGALMNSNTDVELAPDWLQRFPFNAVAYSLAEPISLHDGHRLCHYSGMIVAGINSTRVGTMTPRAQGSRSQAITSEGSQFAHYLNIPAAQGVRCLWVFKEDGDPSPQLQTVSLPLRGPLARQGGTLAGLIDAQITLAQDAGRSGGSELPVLIPLSLSLLLYTAAGDPEIDWPPAEQISRIQQIRTAQIGHLGWRTGAALRQARSQPGRAGGDAQPGLGGWRLPTHIRKAHWHRVRVVERDEHGHTVGRRDGVEGIDWHYEVRWYPPTPVNAAKGVGPMVRNLA